MGGELQALKLGAVCSKIGSGATPRGGKEAYRGGATSLIRSQNIHNDRFVHDGLVRIDDAQASELRNVIVEHGDVLLNITGDSVARCCQVDPSVLPARVNQHVAIIRPKPELLDAQFLRYSMVSPTMQARLLGLASAGATRNALTKAMIEGLVIMAPPLAEQRAIARILGALDDKIELNRKMNATLEAMARALFKSWFVDFDPVRAKAQGRAPSGMDAETTKLFPSELVDSELGDIPRGWSVASIGDLAEIVGGSTPSTKEPAYWDNGVHHWATPKDLSALATPVVATTERKITEEGLRQISSGLLPVGTVLLSSRAPIGYLGIAEVPLAVNQGFIAMKPHSGISSQFLLRWAEAAHEEIVGRANGSTFLEISKSNFRTIQLVRPSAPVLDAFHVLADCLYRRVVINEQQSRALAHTRDQLLPRLLSGELPVDAAERAVEEIA